MHTTTGSRVSVIVQRDASGLSAVRNYAATLPHAVITEELPIIDAVVVEMDRADFAAASVAPPPGVRFTSNQRRLFVDPIPPPSDTWRLDSAVPTLGVEGLWRQGYHGQGVGIAILDTGIAPHPDVADRILAFKDFVLGRTEPYDDQGHGTHVAGDAAGSGAVSEGRFSGTAPRANLVGIKVLDKRGAGRISDIIKGIEWAVRNRERYNIRVLNMSLGGNVSDSYRDDPVAQAAARAVDAGIVAVVAAGNSGPKSETIGTPGNHPRVLTVGALDDRGTADRADDDLAPFSSRGPTAVDGLAKPDVLAPGVAITSATSPGSAIDRMPRVPHVGKWYVTLSGTSMATPTVAGVVADLLAAVPDATPDAVKEALRATAHPLQGKGYDPNEQGAGCVDAEAALRHLRSPA